MYRGADGDFTLYEDENVNYNYEKGLYSMIRFTYDEEEGVLTMDERQGEFPGMQETRTFRVIAVSPSGVSDPVTVIYSGEKVSVRL